MKTKEPIILTVDGEPVIASVPIGDTETVALSTHPQFFALIEQSRARQKAEGGISSAEMRRRLGLTPAAHNGGCGEIRGAYSNGIDK